MRVREINRPSLSQENASQLTVGTATPALLELQHRSGNRAVAREVARLASAGRLDRAATAHTEAPLAEPERKDEQRLGTKFRTGWSVVKQIRELFGEAAIVKATEPEFMMLDGLLGLTDDEVHEKLKESASSARFGSISEILDAASDFIVGHIKLLMQIGGLTVSKEAAEALEQFGETAGAWFGGLEAVVHLGADVTALRDKELASDAKADAAEGLAEHVARLVQSVAQIGERWVAGAEAAGEATEVVGSEVAGSALSGVAVGAGAVAFAAQVTWEEFKWATKNVYGSALGSLPIIALSEVLAAMRSTRASLSQKLTLVAQLDGGGTASDEPTAASRAPHRQQLISDLKHDMTEFLENISFPEGTRLGELFKPYRAITDVDSDDALTILTYAHHLVAALDYACDTRNYAVKQRDGRYVAVLALPDAGATTSNDSSQRAEQ